MKGLQLKDQAGAWQLISGNVNRETSADVGVILKRLLKLECAHTHLPEFVVAGNKILGRAKSEVAWFLSLP